jgi:hypothetical protein
VIVNWAADKQFVEQIPSSIAGVKAGFGLLLYEMMWCQRHEYPRLPVPYALYYMIDLLKQRGGLKTEGIFRQPGTDGVIREILADAAVDISAFGKGDVNVIASLLKIWLAELPNPIVPIELVTQFEEMCEQNKMLGFVELLPQVHRLTLFYLVGFLQDVCRNTDYTGMDRVNIATIFGPCIVNPRKAAPNEPERIQRLTEISAAFCSKLIEVRDTSIVYPLSPVYLEKKAAPTMDTTNLGPHPVPQTEPEGSHDELAENAKGPQQQPPQSQQADQQTGQQGGQPGGQQGDRRGP